jgi:hypothetical protein
MKEEKEKRCFKLTMAGLTFAKTTKSPAYSALLIHIFDPLMT